jgi:AcrR family transcriptional regulator
VPLLLGKGKKMANQSTLSDIMSVTELLLVERGFKGFSFQDVAERLNISKTAIYHYFRTKEDLVDNLISNYADEFTEKIRVIYDTTNVFKKRIEKYLELFEIQIQSNKVCLCCFLGMELNLIAESSQKKIELFFARNLSWLQKVYIEEFPLESTSKADLFAVSLFSMLQGAFVISRVTKKQLNLAGMLNACAVNLHAK